MPMSKSVTGQLAEGCLGCTNDEGILADSGGRLSCGSISGHVREVLLDACPSAQRLKSPTCGTLQQQLRPWEYFRRLP